MHAMAKPGPHVRYFRELWARLASLPELKPRNELTQAPMHDPYNMHTLFCMLLYMIAASKWLKMYPYSQPGSSPALYHIPQPTLFVQLHFVNIAYHFLDGKLGKKSLEQLNCPPRCY